MSLVFGLGYFCAESSFAQKMLKTAQKTTKLHKNKGFCTKLG